MKVSRLILVGGAALAGVVVLAAIVAFNGSFQTWAVRKALAGRPELKASVGSISASLSRVVAKDIRVEQAGAVVVIPYLEANLPLVSAALRDKVLISRFVSRGWTIDLSRPSGSGAPAAPAIQPAAAAVQVFAGVFGLLDLPFDLALDGVRLEGDVILGEGRGRSQVTLTGGGLAAGREGKFEMAGEARLADPKVNSLGVRGTLIAAMATPRSFLRVTLHAEASAKGTQFPNGVKLAADVSAARGATGESYSIQMVSEGRPLVRVEAELPGKASRLLGTWQVNVRDVDLAPFTLGQPLPVFTVAGAGRFDSDAAFTTAHAVGKLNVAADRLEILDAKLVRIGAVKLEADFDLAQREQSIAVERLDAQLAGSGPVVAVQALQPFQFNWRTRQLESGSAAKDLVGIVLHGLPLPWLQPFFAGVDVTGGEVRGEFVASARPGGVMLRSKTPLTAEAVSVTQGAKPVLSKVDLALEASADIAPQGWQAEIASLTAKVDGAPLLTLDAKMGQLAGANQPVKTTGKIAANLPVLAGQPWAKSGFALTQGDAAVEFTASLGTKQEILARVALKNLAVDPKVSTEKLPALSTEFRADISANGQIVLHVPVLIEREGRKSDLTLAGTVTPGKPLLTLDAQVTSGNLVLNDANILGALVPSARENPPDAKKPADNGPPWADMKGTIALTLKKVIYSDTFQASNVVGTLRLEGGALKFDGIRAGLNEQGEAKLNGTVTFDVAKPQPYALAADLALTEFDPGPLFRALNPGQPPTVEGRFDVRSKLTGEARTLDALPLAASGDFQLMSRGGISRLLPVSYANKADAGGRLAAWIAKGSSAIDALKGRTEESDLTSYAKAVTEITRLLSVIEYDQLNVRLTRDAALNTILNEFTLISPELRLTGVGQTTHRTGGGLLEDGLAMEFKLRARGHAGAVLKYLGTLDQAQDELGYFGSTLPLKVGGTLGRPDTSELNQRLATIALERSGVSEKAADLFNKIIGK